MVAHPARVYYYWLGGKTTTQPTGRPRGRDKPSAAVVGAALANRYFLARAVRYLAASAASASSSTSAPGCPRR